MTKFFSSGKVSNLLPSIATLMVICACALLSGCATDGVTDALMRPAAAVVTNTVTVTEIKTNFVPVLVQVPGSNVFKTNFVEKVTTNEVVRTEVQTNTVYVARTSITTGIGIAQAAAPLAGPYAPAVEAGLGLAGGILGWLVKRKNAQVRAAAGANAVLNDANDSLAAQLKATIVGVENVAGALPEGQGAKVKNGIREVSKLLGVAEELDATVREHTS